MKIKNTLRDITDLLIASVKGFSEDRVPKLSASLAYFTVFSITPLVTIIITIGTFIYKEEAVTGKLFSQLSRFMGADLAMNIQSFVEKSTLSGKSNIALIIGIFSLLLGASAVFREIQDSINLIWEVKAKPKKGWVKMIVNRLLSFSMVLALGFIMLVSLVLSSVLAAFTDYLSEYFPQFSLIIIGIITNIFTLCVITLLFAVIFKVLPDVVLKWKPALVGAGVTTILFAIGKFLIDFYIKSTNPGAVFGAAGSIILMLVWVYYTAFILYFGAEFTQVYAEKYSDGIKPSKHAVHLKIIQEENKVDVLPPQHPEYTS